MYKKISYNIERKEKEIKNKLSIILKKYINDNRINNLTIFDVKLYKDLSLLKVFIFSTDDFLLKKKIEILNNASKFIGKILIKSINIKFFPKIIFLYDNSILKADYIVKLINKINN